MRGWAVQNWRAIWRRIFLRIFRWKIVAQLHPLRVRAGLALLVALVIFVFSWRIFARVMTLWVGRLSHPIFQAAQDHPAFGRFIHILINAIPDSAYALLALAGLGYLAPGVIKRLEGMLGVRVFLFIFFGFFGAAAIIVNAVNRESQEFKDGQNDNRMGLVLKDVTGIQDALNSKTAHMTEAERRADRLTALRDEYILRPGPVDPEIVAGRKAPPSDWLNTRLKQLGEEWSVSEEAPKVGVASIPRSYLTLVGSPLFAGGKAEGDNFQPGSLLSFNMHFQVTGPNSIQSFGSARTLLVEPDFTSETQKAAIASFLREFEKEKKESKEEMLPGTIMPGENRFFSVEAHKDNDIGRNGKPWIVDQDDLDKLKAGTEIAFIMTVQPYKDRGVMHHLRRCVWLQPPAQPPGIWHFCEGFPDSD
jgi:hypothetical protein